MTEHAYLKDPYQTRLSTRLLELGEADERPFALLEDTLFYPEGGGQPPDHGRLGTARVVDVQKSADGIRHFLASADGVEPGPVDLEIDWERRFDHMQQHSAQHLLTAVADERFGLKTTSFHLGRDVCDIELDVPELPADRLRELEAAVADLIRSDRAVHVRHVKPESLEGSNVRSRGLPPGHTGPVRVVHINGVDECACGGTHLRSTCEIESIKLLGTESIRGGTRLFWVAGRRVLKRLQAHEERNRTLREILGASDDELPEVARLKVEQQKEAKKQLRRMEERWADAVAEILATKTGPWVEAHFEDAGAGALGRIARGVVERSPELAIFLTGEDDGAAFFVLARGKASTVDLPPLGKEVAEILAGRGGGKGPFFQGRAGSLERREEALAFLDKAS